MDSISIFKVTYEKMRIDTFIENFQIELHLVSYKISYEVVFMRLVSHEWGPSKSIKLHFLQKIILRGSMSNVLAQFLFC